MKRVLLLAYLFPPIANSGTQRPLKFAKYLSQYGWDPIVMTAAHFDKQPTDSALLDELPKSVRVIRVPMLSEVISDTIYHLGCRTPLAKRIGDGVGWRLQTRYRRPDLYALWRPTATREAIKLFHREGFDAIFATGFPWTTLLIGRDVARATGRPLIADFRDPWAAEDLLRTPDHAPPDEERVQETEVLREAAVAITVAPSMTRRFIAAHPDIDETKFVTIQNGFDPVDLGRRAPRTDGQFRIVFTGVWKEGYNPAPLYDVLDWLRRSQPQLLAGVELVAAGFAPGEAARRGLTEYVREVGLLPHREAIALMHSADVLFMTNGGGDRQHIAVPGKLYEYLATGHPVLALTNPEGDAGRLLTEIGGGVVVSPEDPGLLFTAVAKICRDRRLAVPPVNREALSSFERVNLTRRLAGVLDEAVKHEAIRGNTTRLRSQASSADGDQWPHSEAALRS